MEANVEIKQELPLGLQEDLRRELGTNENVRVSLPGSMGEALVVTDRRVLILRDRGSAAPACDVYSYGLSSVRGTQVVQSGLGGFLELSVSERPADPDHARIYFPYSEFERFRAAAAYIDSAVSSASPGSASPHDRGEEGTHTCAGCGAPAAARDVFCSRCGKQLQVICRVCGRASYPDSVHCPGCGSVMLEFTPDCPQCGGRVQSWMAYCPDCGSALGVRCAACGAAIVPGWKHCASCGRLLGSETIDASAARALQRRLQQQKEAERATHTRPAVPTTAPEDVSRAQQHNLRGQELFDAEQLDAAIAEFERAVSLDPANPAYHCNLAIAYEEAGREEDALAEYEKTLELDPDDLSALLSLGYIYNEKGEADKAQTVWSRILVIAPNSAEAQEVRENLRHQSEL